MAKRRPESKITSVHKAIRAAEKLLPGRAAPPHKKDPRWQAIIEIGEFVETEPEVIWSFVLKWGKHSSQDLRAAIACCLLEHLLSYHFDLILPKARDAARSSARFADTLLMCWKMGQSEEPRNSRRLDRLRSELRNKKRIS